MLKYKVQAVNRGETHNRRRTFLCSTDGSATHDSSGTSPSCSSTSSHGSASGRSSLAGGRTRSLSTSSLSSDASAESPSCSSGSATAGAAYPQPGLLKVYTEAIRADAEYKTLFATTVTTAAEVVEKILSKFRIGYKDTRLFYLTMEIKTKTDRREVGTTLILDRTARPLALQNCHPRDMSRFTIQISAGYPVRVYDYCVSPQSNYKSVLIAKETTCDEVVNILLQASRVDDAVAANLRNYALVRVDKETQEELILPGHSTLLSALTQGRCQLQLRLAQQRRGSATSPIKRKQYGGVGAKVRLVAPPATLQRRLAFDSLATQFENDTF